MSSTREPTAGYTAPRTAQITVEGEDSSSLVIHELDDDGETLCHDPVRPWNGHRMVLTEKGPGVVSCGRCARIRRSRPYGTVAPHDASHTHH